MKKTEKDVLTLLTYATALFDSDVFIQQVLIGRAPSSTLETPNNEITDLLLTLIVNQTYDRIANNAQRFPAIEKEAWKAKVFRYFTGQ